MDYLLRVEGVNLANVIDDTDQISVRRGGGLMILNAVVELKESLDPSIGSRLIEISTGASIGLFQLETTENLDERVIRKAVENHFRDRSLAYTKVDDTPGKLALKHGTFVVDVVPVEQGAAVRELVQMAVASNRWQQLQQSTLSLHGLWDSSTEPCHLDRTRSGTVQRDLNADDKGKMISKTVADRWDYGRGARQRFYQRELADFAKESPDFALTLGGLKFTDDLKSLCEPFNSGMTSENAPKQFVTPENLRDKMAVFYVDGNGFGKIGREIMHDHGVEGYKEWSTKLHHHHRRLLRDLVSVAAQDNSWKAGEEIRLETLLWGGDEILWVLPAWKGWEVARWFFGQAHKVEVMGQNYPLTYGCGLVFCHAKAPLKNIMALAHRLGDQAKKARNGQNLHRLAYEVLESYDDISGDLTTHRRRFLPPQSDVHQLVIDPGQLSTCWDDLLAIAQCSEFPMRQLYMLTKAWREKKDFSSYQRRLDDACRDANVKTETVVKAFGGDPSWLHLLQMLPYLPATSASSQGGEA